MSNQPREANRAFRVQWVHLWVTVLLFTATGASCPRRGQVVNDHAPTVLTAQSTLEDVIRVVNANSARIQQVQSQNATLRVEGLPPLETNYAFERPRRFRLRAETRLTGVELDLGSNDELYWIWVKRNEQPAVYWARHDEMSSATAREILPISPDWLIEALGVVQLDPLGRYSGPTPVRVGQLELRTQVTSPQGPLTKVLVIDDTRGWVLEQHLIDSAGQPLASAVASGFEFNAVHGVSLPRFIEVHLPPAQLHFTLHTEQHAINELSGDPRQLWTIPQIPGQPMVNLAEPGVAAEPRPATLSLRQRAPGSVYTAQRTPLDRRESLRRTPPLEQTPFERLR